MVGPSYTELPKPPVKRVLTRALCVLLVLTSSIGHAQSVATHEPGETNPRGKGQFQAPSHLVGDSVYEAWVARYNGPGNADDYARALAIDDAGNVYVTGYSSGEGTSFDYATIKYDAPGQMDWVARYNGPGNADDYARALAIDGAGNIYVTGYSSGEGTSFDYATIKYDASGQMDWVARYNGPGNADDYARALAIDGAGNIYVTGYSSGEGTSFDYATIKYDASGQLDWIARYNGPGNLFDFGLAIAVDGSGNVYVTGDSDGGNTFGDYATIKYGVSGQEQWVVRYNGPWSGPDRAIAISVDEPGSVYVAGHSYGSGTVTDYTTIKYDDTGQEQWVARYEGLGWDDATAMGLDGSGNVYVTGYSSLDGLTCPPKTDPVVILGSEEGKCYGKTEVHT